MKKLMILCSLFFQGFMFYTFADCKPIKNDISFCGEEDELGSVRIVLKSDCSCELWINNILSNEGTWDSEDPQNQYIQLTFEDQYEGTITMRCELITRRILDRTTGRIIGTRYEALDFNGFKYEPCD